MVILATAICTKTGKPLISRQTTGMARGYIEGLLSSFPKLMIEGQQHTTVETEAVRYVYLPLFDDMYAVLVTTRNSNIVQDMDTLQLVTRVVPEICDYGTQEDVLEKAFELLSAFDEIVAMGYRENIELGKLKTILEMESHEEKIQEIIDRNKEREAKNELKRKAKLFEMQRKSGARSGGIGGTPGIGSIGMGSSGIGSSSSGGGIMEMDEPAEVPRYVGMDTRTLTGKSEYKPSGTIEPKARGMQLGRKTKDAMTAEVLGEDEVEATRTQMEKVSMVNTTTLPRVDRKGIHVLVEEKMAMVVNRDGGLENMEVKGDLSVVVSEDGSNQASIQVDISRSEAATQYKTHPNMDKNKFHEEGVLELKNKTRNYPLNQPVGLLKWRYVGHSEDNIPLSINCWPSPTGDGSCEVNIEFELLATRLILRDVVISIPIPRGAQPVVGDVDAGVYEVNRGTGCLDWQIPLIDNNINGSKTGSIDFVVSGENTNAFFPVSASFVSETPFCGIQVVGATENSGQDSDYSQQVVLSTSQYLVV